MTYPWKATDTQLPRVFVGCPYGRTFRPFRKALDEVPFRFTYAIDYLDTQHLLTIMRRLIRRADFCLFDISTWNANVTLEAGLADASGARYYILCNSNHSKEVPSDFKGLQRIQYSSYRALGEGRGTLDDTGLFHQMSFYLLRRHPLLRKVWTGYPTKTRSMQFYFAMRLMAGLREEGLIPHDQVKSFSTGTYLKEHERQKALGVLERQKLIKVSRRGVTPIRPTLFKAA